MFRRKTKMFEFGHRDDGGWRIQGIADDYGRDGFAVDGKSTNFAGYVMGRIALRSTGLVGVRRLIFRSWGLLLV